MLKTLSVAAAVFAAAVPAVSANAATLIINVAGAQSVGLEGTAGNTTATYLLGAGAHITGIAWDVTINASSPSWRSEAGFGFGRVLGSSLVVLTPGIADDLSGVGTYTGSGSLVPGLDFFLGANGILATEFFESFNDTAVSPDAVWTRGTITITYDLPAAGVPEPATWAMMMLGFGLLGASLRRRTTTRVRFAI